MIEENDYSSWSEPIDEGKISTVMQRVFKMMTAGLIVTACTAAFVLSNINFLYFIMKSIWVWIIAELVLVLFLTFKLKDMGTSTCRLTFYLYAIVNGCTLAPLCYAYTESSIATTFLCTALMFGVMALIGHNTKRDLTKMGSFFIMALLGVIIASIVNLFLKNSMLDLIISIVGIIIFVGLTAYDVQKIKGYANAFSLADEESMTKVVTMGALSLYLDFINIFIKLLRLMGKRKN